MTTWPFCSVLARQFERFVGIRQLSGTKYESPMRLLAYFDRFLVEQRYGCKYLTRGIVEGYVSSGPHWSEAVRRNRFMIVRQFCVSGLTLTVLTAAGSRDT